MCCLFGLVDYGDVLSQRQRTKLITVLSRECEVRGTDATGISYVSDGRLCIYKRPLAAHKLHFHIPTCTKVIMGHTRLTTQGSERQNYNNHPFFGRVPGCSFALAHNGVLYNDRVLRNTEHLPPTNIKTDSYIIVQLIEKYKALNFEGLKHTAEKIEGSFTFTALDQQNNLYLVKGENPICIYHFQGFYVYASTEEILKRALKKLGFINIYHSPIKLSCGDILQISVNGKTGLASFDTGNIDMWNYYMDRSYPSYCKSSNNEYEEKLINYAKYCGIAPEEVEMLLAFGYDTDTIEELLYDPSLLQSCLDEMLCDCLY